MAGFGSAITVNYLLVEYLRWRIRRQTRAPPQQQWQHPDQVQQPHIEEDNDQQRRQQDHHQFIDSHNVGSRQLEMVI